MAKKMTMKIGDIADRLRMVRRRGFNCVICGREFDNIACVTYEHVVPKSRAKFMKNNVALSHYSCNRLRGTDGLGEAWRRVEELHDQIGDEAFEQWLAKLPPNRDVPDIALLPIAHIMFLFGRKHCRGLTGPANDYSISRQKMSKAIGE